MWHHASRSSLLPVVAFSALAWLGAPMEATPASAAFQSQIVLVTDGDGQPLAGVDVALLQNNRDAVRYAQTDSTGSATLEIPGDLVFPATLVARKIGYVSARTTIDRPDDVATPVRIVLGQVSALDTVRTTARTLASRNYVLGATEIGASKRPIASAYDAIAKLRPQIMGDPYRCPEDPVQNVWVNGRRVFFDHARSANKVVRAQRPGDMWNAGPPTLEKVLMSIKPEHVLEIRYTNCWDTSMAGIGTDNAIYISLIPGVAFDLGRGSYAVSPR